MRLRLYIIKRKRMRKLIKSLVLFLIAGALSVVLLPLGIIWTVGEILVRIFTSSEKKSAFAKSI
nr:MAG TPA: Multidrug efflux pump subunit AcrB transporter, Multidrug efflux pump [Caudoviricetes sp.]DAY34105.1 MAG TPA: Multidrug efflux pump subunit AcrB transporter, Multidrug efflux pump [Caudoviricetes sp.]